MCSSATSLAEHKLTHCKVGTRGIFSMKKYSTYVKTEVVKGGICLEGQKILALALLKNILFLADLVSAQTF